MEAELIKIDSKTDNLKVTKEANVDEANSIYLRKELSTEAYKEKMIIYIEKLTLLKLESKRIQKNGVQYMK